MDWNYYKEFLLSAIPNSKLVSGGSHVNCKCLECGEPGSKSGSMHMYISIPNNENEPSLYYCHKCNCKGIVTHNTLIDWGIYDQEIAVDLDNSLKKLAKRKKITLGYESFFINNHTTTIDDVSEYKRQYICNRVGVDLSYEDLRKLKIILNLNDLFKDNRITSLTRDPNIVSQLDKFFIGFISIDNAFINMRKVVDDNSLIKSIDKRYINYQIFKKDLTIHRFYTIPTEVDLNYGPVKMHVSEGPFDILSVYLNCRKREPGIYTCVSGNNYGNVIRFFLETFMLPNIELHFYPDNDKYGSVNRIKWVLKNLPDKLIPTYIHYNTYDNEKDFGVPSNHIKESILKVQ